MVKITEYEELLWNIPVEKQAFVTKRETWEKRLKILDNKNACKKIIQNLFGDRSEIEITRGEILEADDDTSEKLVKILLWGYPSGGRGENIQELFKNIKNIEKTLDDIRDLQKKKGFLTEDDYKLTVKEFEKINCLGISTWTKFLYFFNIKIEEYPCVIFDRQICNSLNRNQIEEFSDIKDIKHTEDDYVRYLQYVSKCTHVFKSRKISQDKIELFLFYFNNHFKF
jgi:hypothetical protein